ncbi:MAG: aminodeoxychorismate lyase, partial [Parcubacteria group bacterium CG_4_9_14_0_2_um_filter_41_8]
NGTSPALTKEQLKIDSEYNTYLYRGLPPTPIGNPGIASIRAALYPENTDYLYFLSTPEGETVFSRTLDEHNIAKAKYLK